MDKIEKPRRSERANRPRAARASVTPNAPLLVRIQDPIRWNCDGCRKVKERCEGGMPCRRCSHLKRRCEFTGSTARFPVQAGTGIGGHLTGASSSSSAAAHGQPEDMDDAARSLFDNQAAKGVPRGVKRSRSRATEADDDSDSSDQVNIDDITVQPLENNVTHYSGEFSHFNFSMRIKNWIEKSGPYRTDAPDAPKIREFYRVEELQSPSDPSGLVSSCPPRYIADFLVRAFFNHAEGNYFYVDRTWLNRKMDLVYDAPASLSRRDVPMLCVLFMVLAIGTQYAYLDSDVWRHGGGGSSMEEVNTFSEDSVGIMLYQQACKLLPDVITISSSESVQACLLIGLYTLPLDPSGLSWVYLGLAMKLAVQNGMHRRYPGQSSDLAMLETRTRVWWTCYMVEKRVGTFHGRPTSIASQEVDADWPTERPNIWPGSPPQNTPQLVATLQLSQFLTRISHIISCFKTNDKQTTLLALHRLNTAKDELHHWWNSLPEEVSFASTNSQHAEESQSPLIPRAAFHLRLEFCMLRMYAGRPFITPRDESHPPKASTSKSPPVTHPREGTEASPAGSAAPDGGNNSGSTPTSQGGSRHRSALVSDCVDAALTVVDICRTLQAGIGLARASYTEFSTLRIALLVILSQFLAKYQRRHTTPTATNALRQPLGEGIAMLKSMSTWGASARFDASLIEAFEHTIARMESNGRGESQAEVQRPKESNYEMFKRWESMWQGGPQGGLTGSSGHRHGNAMSKAASSSTRNDASIMDGSADIQPVPVPAPAPAPLTFGEDPLGNAWDGVGSADGAPVTATGPETGSSFGIDWNYSSMPMLEGLSAMLEQGYGFGVDMENQNQNQNQNEQGGAGRMDY